MLTLKRSTNVMVCLRFPVLTETLITEYCRYIPYTTVTLKRKVKLNTVKKSSTNSVKKQNKTKIPKPKQQTATVLVMC